MNIVDATRAYEAWMAKHIAVVKSDLATKHQEMEEDAFVFLRATFYRWLQLWPNVCASVATAPAVPSVGDLHLENFGTWRDAEGRLVWGVNDVDEACLLPYTNDLVRLATSAVLATRHDRINLNPRDLCDAILDGYTASLAEGGRPFVLAERRRWLRRIAINKLRAPAVYWPKLLKKLRRPLESVPHDLLRLSLPEPRLPYDAFRRTSGVGSLGRSRIVALATWCGGRIAREAKARLPSAAVWAAGRASASVDGAVLLARAVRAQDPFLTFHDRWTIRRLAPDCSKIELDDMPRAYGEERLLYAMGWETANVHLGRPAARIKADLKGRPRRWLAQAAVDMADAVAKDWKRWVRR